MENDQNVTRIHPGTANDPRQLGAPSDSERTPAAPEMGVDTAWVSAWRAHRAANQPVVLSRPRYSYVRSDGYHDLNSWYAIHDNKAGSPRVMAERVPYWAAVEIVRALNEKHELKVFLHNC